MSQPSGVLGAGLGNRNPTGGDAGGIEIRAWIALDLFAAGGLGLLLLQHQHHHQPDGGGRQCPFHREAALVRLERDRFAETLFHGAATLTAGWGYSLLPLSCRLSR